MPNFCPNCGAGLQYPEAEICPSCGVRIRDPPGPKEEKSPGLAAVLSLLFGGSGQVYNGDLAKGLAILLGQFFGTLFFIIPGIIIWVFAIYDAYSTSKQMNLGKIPFAKATQEDVIIYIVALVGVIIVTVLAIFFVLLFMFAPVVSSPDYQHSVSGYQQSTPGYHQFSNPGFETGNLAGWKSGSKVSVLGDRSHGGTYSCHFDMSGTQASDYISQTVDLTNAESITFWGMGESNTWPFYLYIDGKPVQTSNAVSNTWTRHTLPVSGYPGVHTVAVKWNGGPGMYGADIDDFSISYV